MGLTGAALLVTGTTLTPLGATLLVLAMATMAAERWTGPAVGPQGLRRRYLALAERVERLDEMALTLRESEEIHRSLVDTFGDLVVHRDAKGRVRFANAAFRRLFGADGAELPEVLREALAQASDAEDENGVKLRTISLETASGPRTFAWVDVPARDPRTGAPTTRSLARDITEHREALAELAADRDRAEARNAARSRFLATAAHEIRNPLNGLNGMAALLEGSKLDARQRSHVEAISAATASLAHLIEDLLDDARMEVGRLVLDHEPFDPGALVAQASELMATRAHAKGIDLMTHVGATVPRLITGDAARLRQVLLNLLGNAVKFTGRGVVMLQATHADGALRFAVSDTGPGMSEEDRERIFDLFEHADESLARRLGGVGLGLSISRGIAERMGGTIAVDSRPGEGSVFTLEIPVCEPASERPEPTLPRRTVALVTDNAPIAGALRAFVAERGGEVSVMDAAHFNRVAGSAGWPHGPVLIDERIVELLDDAFDRGEAVILRRSEATTDAPGERWLRLPWRNQALDDALAGRRRTVDAPPLVPEHDPALADPQTLVPVDAHGAGMHVLVAEDDPVTQLLTRTWLERLGYQVELADDGDVASRLFREAVEAKTPFDAAVIDLNMPGLDGFAALRGMRLIEKRRRMPAVPIVVATGDVREETRLKAIEAGASAVLVKPVEMAALASALTGALSDAERGDGHKAEDGETTAA